MTGIFCSDKVVTMDKPKEKLKQLLRMLWQKKYQLCMEFLVLCAVFGAFNFFRTGSYADAVLSFNYSEASQGLAPNKTRLNAYEIVSDEVLQKAINRIGLQGSISPSELASSLSITPYQTGSVSGSTDFISTSYNISINTKNLDLGNRKTLDLLQSVCESYRDFFLENYGDNQTLIKNQMDVTIDCEPFLRIQDLQVRTEQLQRYLNARLNENKTFVDSKNADSSTNNFTTLAKQVNNIVDYDIPNVTAFVIENSIARDPATLVSILEYKNKIDDLAMRKQMAYYDADKDGISLYEKSMTSVVMIPTVDDLSEYYMSRTKTAMDTMARAADDSLNTATNYQSDIVDTNYIIQKMQACTNDAQYLASAQEMINRLENSLNQIASDLFILDKAYIRYKSQNYISFSYSTFSFIQRFRPKNTVIEAFAVLLFGTSAVHFFKSHKKGRKVA